jgi:hypothetical protein
VYNTVTVELIKKIPSIGGYDIERLPQTLTRVYARIISLKTKYEDGTLPFNDMELDKDYRELDNLANTLELLLIGNDEREIRQSVAYVAATARKLMVMIRMRQTLPLSLLSIPEELYAALLYVISGSLADAQEVANHFSTDVASSNGAKMLMKCVKWLLGGKLLVLDRFSVTVSKLEDPVLMAEELLWVEMIKGIKLLVSYLKDGSEYSGEAFQRVEELSSYKINLKETSQSDIYTGTLVLSRLMMMAAEELMNHALIRVDAPHGVIPSDWNEAIRRQITYRPYLWNNHIEAIREGVLNVGTSAVITFPTGAGKTTLSELKMASCLLTGKDVVYLVPTHALESQVYISMKQLVERLNEPVVNNRDGEYADFDDDEDNPVKVMTPEHCLTIIRVQPELLSNTGLVVFDEFHLMSGDENDNRAVDSMLLMTELLTRHPDADYLLISAVVSNGNEVAEWIAGATGRHCLLLDNPWKPTSQLQGCVVYNTTQIEALHHLIATTKRSMMGKQKTPPKALQKQMIIQPECLFSLKTIWDTMNVVDYYHCELLDHSITLMVGHNEYGKWYLSANYNEVAAELATKYAAIGLKTIIFALDPKTANKINKSLTERIGEDKTEYLRMHHSNKMDLIGMELGGMEYSYLTCCQSATLHHSNLLPEERLISEDYFTSADGVAVMVATPTIAQGINLPADIVLIAGSSRFDMNSKGMEQIDAHEILNAAGRAGRAGFRSHGTAILIPSKPIGLEKNQIDSVWKDIKEDVFSKGDRCLKVEDPLASILTQTEYDASSPLLLKLQDEEEKLKLRLGKSFYAYKMKKEGRQEQFNSQVDNLVGTLLGKKSSDGAVSDLAAKTNVEESTIEHLLNVMTKMDAMSTLEMDVNELLDWMSGMLVENYGMIDNLLGNVFGGITIRKTLGMKEDQPWSKIAVTSLFNIVRSYVNGATLLEIEQGLRKKTDAYLKNARVFAIKVIPSVSYICGTLIQVLLLWLDKHGVGKEDCPNDMKVFASCVKEGVLSYDMLMKKYRGKQMRVECHYKYNH